MCARAYVCSRSAHPHALVPLTSRLANLSWSASVSVRANNSCWFFTANNASGFSKAYVNVGRSLRVNTRCDAHQLLYGSRASANALCTHNPGDRYWCTVARARGYDSIQLRRGISYVPNSHNKRKPWSELVICSGECATTTYRDEACVPLAVSIDESGAPRPCDCRRGSKLLSCDGRDLATSVLVAGQREPLPVRIPGERSVGLNDEGCAAQSYLTTVQPSTLAASQQQSPNASVPPDSRGAGRQPPLRLEHPAAVAGPPASPSLAAVARSPPAVLRRASPTLPVREAGPPQCRSCGVLHCIHLHGGGRVARRTPAQQHPIVKEAVMAARTLRSVMAPPYPLHLHASVNALEQLGASSHLSLWDRSELLQLPTSLAAMLRQRFGSAAGVEHYLHNTTTSEAPRFVWKLAAILRSNFERVRPHPATHMHAHCILCADCPRSVSVCVHCMSLRVCVPLLSHTRARRRFFSILTSMCSGRASCTRCSR